MSDQSVNLPTSTVRLARCNERMALEDLQRRASLVSESYRKQLLAHPDAIVLPHEQIEDGRVFVAERQGMTLGFCVVLARTNGDAEIDGLFVEPGVWKQGVGRQLVAHAERIAASSGASSLCVIANPEAVDFYVACGFELTGKQETRFGMALAMRKPVPVCKELQ